VLYARKLSTIGALCAETTLAIDVNLLKAQTITYHLGYAYSPEVVLYGSKLLGLHTARNGGA
jgi:hypothetical protein